MQQNLEILSQRELQRRHQSTMKALDLTPAPEADENCQVALAGDVPIVIRKDIFWISVRPRMESGVYWNPTAFEKYGIPIQFPESIEIQTPEFKGLIVVIDDEGELGVAREALAIVMSDPNDPGVTDSKIELAKAILIGLAAEFYTLSLPPLPQP